MAACFTPRLSNQICTPPSMCFSTSSPRNCANTATRSATSISVKCAKSASTADLLAGRPKKSPKPPQPCPLRRQSRGEGQITQDSNFPQSDLPLPASPGERADHVLQGTNGSKLAQYRQLPLTRLKDSAWTASPLDNSTMAYTNAWPCAGCRACVAKRGCSNMASPS